MKQGNMLAFAAAMALLCSVNSSYGNNNYNGAFPSVSDGCSALDASDAYCEFSITTSRSSQLSSLKSDLSKKVANNVFWSVNGNILSGLDSLVSNYDTSTVFGYNELSDRCRVMDWGVDCVSINFNQLLEFDDGTNELTESFINIVFDDSNNNKIKEYIAVMSNEEYSLMKEHLSISDASYGYGNEYEEDILFTDISIAQEFADKYCDNFVKGWMDDDIYCWEDFLDENVRYTTNGYSLQGKQTFIDFFGKGTFPVADDFDLSRCKVLEFGGNAISVMADYSFPYKNSQLSTDIVRIITNMVFDYESGLMLHGIEVGSQDVWEKMNKAANNEYRN